ncbi:MAG: pantoate--beta-alanine ligase [Rhodocyclaceae bacterium]|nr:pantoate--beta-alanine ligase [Rhodocyclaceae bacterium]
MEIYSNVADLRAALNKLRQQNRRIGFVPTMGNLHAGHISLMHQAKTHAECVVASIFVNRLQFGPHEDFDKYPRTFEADCAQLREAGVDFLFAPTENDLYPEPQTYAVEPPEIQFMLEGECRPGHFRGVATVVMKLFQIVQPDVAVFGKKDYQQLMVIRNMTNQFMLPIRIIGGETVRAEDGLALSSRNGYLGPEERAEAPRLQQTLQNIRQAVLLGDHDYEALCRKAAANLDSHGWKTDYISIRRQQDLAPATAADRDLVIVAASRLGTPRLLDNLEI